MKKVGIITYHRAYNFGSVLQAYALNRYLRNQGYAVETIDFRTEKQASIYKTFEPVSSIMSLGRNVQSLLEYKNLVRHKKRFDDFIDDRICLSKMTFTSEKALKEANLDYDFYFCGSDQIWNPNTTDFDEAYLLSFVNDKSICASYAPSIGIDHIPHEYHELYASHLMNYCAVSIRESKGADILEPIIGFKPIVVLDPVFLLSAQEWQTVTAKRQIGKPYIFCYFIGDVDGMRAFAKKMHKQLKMPLVVVYKNIRDLLYPNIERYDAGPEEFLSLMFHAEYVCTNSFHAVAFSVTFGKDFWVFVDEDNPLSSKSRIHDITQKLGLEERVLNMSNCNVILDKPVDYTKAEQIIGEERQKSFEFISNAIESNHA